MPKDAFDHDISVIYDDVLPADKNEYLAVVANDNEYQEI